MAELCGVRVHGRSKTRFSAAQWLQGWEESGTAARSLRCPNASPDEDGPCYLADIELAGAQVMACDRASGRPLLTCCQVGKGWVYLLCTYAYPGHEALASVSWNIVEQLADRHRRGTIRCRGDREDVYYSVWGENGHAETVYLLNTDWTQAGKARPVLLEYGGLQVPVNVPEGRVTALTCLPQGLLWLEEEQAGLWKCGEGEYRVQSFAPVHLHYHVREALDLLVNGREYRAQAPAGQVLLTPPPDGILTLTLRNSQGTYKNWD